MAKTIFNTTEKSNFILNMKEETLDKMVIKTLITACIIIPALSVISELLVIFNRNAHKFISSENLLEKINELPEIFKPDVGIIIIGVLSMIVVLIAVVKKIADKSLIAPFCIIAGLMVLGAISMLMAISPDTAFYGWDGRNEGLLTLIFYAFLFFMGTLVKSKESLTKFFDFIVGMCLFQCLWSLLHILNIGFEYDYADIYTVLLKDVFLASGTTGNPVAFAMLLSIALAISLTGMLYDSSKKRRIFYGISSNVFVFFLIKTSTLISLIGIILVLVFSLIIAIIKLIKKDGSLTLKPVLVKFITLTAVFALSIVFNLFSPQIYNTTGLFNDEPVENSYYLYDGAIVWEDSFFRLGTSGPYSMKESDFDILKPTETYSFLWGKTLNIIKENPIFGVGADCLIYTQLENTSDMFNARNSFDRPYNDYLYIAATRGIPSLLCYIALLLLVLKKAFTGAKEFMSKQTEWIKTGLLFAVLAYIIISLFGISINTVAPFFWIILGILYSQSKTPSPDVKK
jgi:hypothetical protein